MDRLPPFDQLAVLRSELESDFAAGPEERKRRKRDRIDEILEMLIMAYMFGNESANTMLFGPDIVDTIDPDEPNRPVRIDVDDMNKSVFKDIAGKDWEQRVSEYYDSDSGTVDDVIRVVDTDMNRVYNDSVLDVGEKANAGRVEWSNDDLPVPDTKNRVMKTWLTMADDRVRDTHDYLEGMTVPVDGRFWTFDSDYARYPGDFQLPQNNINCRCRISLSMA
ncbi:MAG: hypothetical protein II602_04835 [Erysipelotrichales bacterium]|nr:hypothetical protein [Erysipelotrichales bacterium]